MLQRLLILASLLFLSQASLPQQLQSTIPDDVHYACPVARPPQLPFIPPWPYSLKAGPGEFWFGTDTLWTALPTDGTWRGLPHYTPSDPTFRQKLFFWRKGYVVRTEPQPKLTVTGRRLDSPAPPLLAEKTASNGWVHKDQPFMVTAINLPTLGCWEITTHYSDEQRNVIEAMRFVVWVTK